MIPHESLVAPRDHLGVLVEPREVAAGLRPGRSYGVAASSSGSTPFQSAIPEPANFAEMPPADTTAGTKLDHYFSNGNSLAALRDLMAQQFGLKRPIVATGHQAEFVHAGVFAKTIAADLLAESMKGTAVFVCVDSDTPKTDRLFVPTSPGGIPNKNPISIPALSLVLPIESQVRLAPSRWRAFFDEVARLEGDRGLLAAFVNGWMTGVDTAIQLRYAMTAAQSAVEAQLGFTPATPVNISALAETPAFRAFAADILGNAAAFADAYNRAKLNYRRRNRVRSPHNPVTDLTRDGERIETPFWVLRPGGSRMRLWVAVNGERLTLFADQERIGDEALAQLRSADAAQPWQVEAVGWRIRPTVITLSAFCRIYLADAFLHGIGGAKYDEITDELLSTFWRVPAAAMICVTATAHLPIVAPPLPPQPRGSLREAWHNPQRIWADLPGELLAEKQQLIRECLRLRENDRANRADRRRNHTSLRDLTERLATITKPRREQLRDAWHDYTVRGGWLGIARDREYFFAMHSRDTMLALIERLRAAFKTNG